MPEMSVSCHSATIPDLVACTFIEPGSASDLNVPAPTARFWEVRAPVLGLNDCTLNGGVRSRSLLGSCHISQIWPLRAAADTPTGRNALGVATSSLGAVKRPPLRVTLV